jgi:hypothetical protein
LDGLYEQNPGPRETGGAYADFHEEYGAFDGIGTGLGRKRFFFEKNNQKTFSTLGHGLLRQRGRFSESFFAFFFQKKEALAFVCKQRLS